MENYSLIKKIFEELIINNELKKDIMFEEKEFYDQNISTSFKISGRVSKSREEKLFLFKESLINSFSEKIGANFVNENFKNIWQVDCGISVGDQFPALDLLGLNGAKINFEPENDKLLLIDFWNINCQFCKPLMEKYVKFYESKKKENRISIVGISNDKNYQDWKRFVATQKWHTIPQYMKSGVTDSLGIIGVPFILIVNKHKEIIYADRAYKIDVERTLDNEKGEISYFPEYSDIDIGDENFLEKSSIEKLKIVSEINEIFKNEGINNISLTVSVKITIINNKNTRKVFAKLNGSRLKYDEEKFEKILKKIQSDFKFSAIQIDVNIIESLVIDLDQDF